jgi:hypothetical protein
MTIVHRLSRKVVLLVAAGIVAMSVGAGIALARGTAAPIGTGVVVVDTNLAYQNAAAAGTGIVLTSSGEVLTNNHVISGATTIKVVVPKTGHSYTARVVGYDRTADVAVLQLQGAANLKTVSVSSAKLGDRLGHRSPQDDHGVRRLGELRAAHRVDRDERRRPAGRLRRPAPQQQGPGRRHGHCGLVRLRVPERLRGRRLRDPDREGADDRPLDLVG